MEVKIEVDVDQLVETSWVVKRCELAIVCLSELMFVLFYEEEMAMFCLELMEMLLLELKVLMVWFESWVTEKLLRWLLETKGLPISCLPR